MSEEFEDSLREAIRTIVRHMEKMRRENPLLFVRVMSGQYVKSEEA